VVGVLARTANAIGAIDTITANEILLTLFSKLI
jgi:hypothetical protein